MLNLRNYDKQNVTSMVLILPGLVFTNLLSCRAWYGSLLHILGCLIYFSHCITKFEFNIQSLTWLHSKGAVHKCHHLPRRDKTLSPPQLVSKLIRQKYQFIQICPGLSPAQSKVVLFISTIPDNAITHISLYMNMFSHKQLLII